MSWCLLESDPGVFSELLEAFGVKGVQVEELWSIDDETLSSIKPVYGLLFLFKWKGRGPPSQPAFGHDGVVFMRQVINNACGTQALLHVLLNRQDVELGQTLTDFKSFVSEMDPETAGSCLSMSDSIRTAHNSFARPEPFVIEEKKATDDDDVFHFIAYTNVGDKVYELDGLKPAPVEIGTAVGGDWLAVARRQLENRIAEYSASEIRFNVMALVKNRKQASLADAAILLQRLEIVFGALISTGEGLSEGLETPDVLRQRVVDSASQPAPSSSSSSSSAAAASSAPAADAHIPDENSAEARQSALASQPFEVADAGVSALLSQYRDLQNQLESCSMAIMGETEKHSRWRIENERRRHNFVPFAVTLMRELAKRGKLHPMYEAGQKKAADARQRQMREAMAAKVGSGAAPAGADAAASSSVSGGVGGGS